MGSRMRGNDETRFPGVFYRASGSGRNWILIALGRFSFPPSRWKFTRDP